MNEPAEPLHNSLRTGYAADVRLPSVPAPFTLVALTQRLAPAALVLVALMPVAFLPSCGGPTAADPGSSARAEAPAVEEPVITGEPAGYNDADVAFAQAVNSWQRQRRDLSSLPGTRSDNPELVEFAIGTATSLKLDAMALAAFAVDWRENPRADTNADADHGVPAIPSIDRGTLTRLDSSRGSDFDALWLHSMLTLDHAGIRAAQAQAARGKNVDAVSIATKIAGEYPAEIDRLTTLLHSNPLSHLVTDPEPGR